jgi:hypothetical protein
MPAGQPRRSFGDRGRLCRSFHAENVGQDEGVAVETQVSRGLVVLFPSSPSVPRLARKVPSRLGQRSPRIQLVEPADLRKKGKYPLRAAYRPNAASSTASFNSASPSGEPALHGTPESCPHTSSTPLSESTLELRHVGNRRCCPFGQSALGSARGILMLHNQHEE